MLEYFLNGIDINTLSKVINTFFGAICHQDNSILFTVNGKYIPLCPRCIGLHSGFFLTLISLVFTSRKTLTSLKKFPKNILFVLIIVVGIHWLGGKIEIFDATTFARILTGLLSGFSFGYLLFTYHTLEKINFVQIRWLTLIILSIITPLFIAEILMKQSNFITTALGIITLINILTILKTVISIFRRNDKNNQPSLIQEVLK